MTLQRSSTAPARPCLTLEPDVPQGRALSQWAIDSIRRAFQENYFPSDRLLTPEQIQFLDQIDIIELERSERDPNESVLYQVLKVSGVPTDYLDDALMPLASALDGVGVYWNPFSPKPMLSINRGVLDSLSSCNKDHRLACAASLGDNLIRICLDMLPVVVPIPPQQVARVREDFRDAITAAFAFIRRRFSEAIDAQKLALGFQVISDLLDSSQALFFARGARLVFCLESSAGRIVEYELGMEFQLGIGSLLGERLYKQFNGQIERAFLKRFRRDPRAQGDIDKRKFQAQQALRCLGLCDAESIYRAYVDSQIPFYYWGAESKRVNPWRYAR